MGDKISYHEYIRKMSHFERSLMDNAFKYLMKEYKSGTLKISFAIEPRIITIHTDDGINCYVTDRRIVDEDDINLVITAKG